MKVEGKWLKDKYNSRCTTQIKRIFLILIGFTRRKSEAANAVIRLLPAHHYNCIDH